MFVLWTRVYIVTWTYSVGPLYQVEVSDSVNSGHRDMSLKDWTAYYESRDRDSFMTMSVEFSRTKLEKCITLPEIVRHVLYFCVQYFFLTSRRISLFSFKIMLAYVYAYTLVSVFRYKCDCNIWHEIFKIILFF